MQLEDYITSIPDFPKRGIIFRDITTIFSDNKGLKLAIDSMQNKIKDLSFDVIVGAESRGFLFGVPLAYNLNKSFIMARKVGKLPREVITEEYSLEYGTACIEMHKDSIKQRTKSSYSR